MIEIRTYAIVVRSTYMTGDFLGSLREAKAVAQPLWLGGENGDDINVRHAI